MEYTLSIPHTETSRFPSAADLGRLGVLLADAGYEFVAVTSNAYRTAIVLRQTRVEFGTDVMAAISGAVNAAARDRLSVDIYAARLMHPALCP